MLWCTPEEHDAHPPETWVVVKAADRVWHLRPHDWQPNDGPLDTFTTKRAAEAAKVEGHLVSLYRDEGRWFAGENVRNWKPYEPEEAPCPSSP